MIYVNLFINSFDILTTSLCDRKDVDKKKTKKTLLIEFEENKSPSWFLPQCYEAIY